MEIKRRKIWRKFTETRLFVRALELSGSKDFFRWAKTDDRPPDIPANPSQVYMYDGWVDWGDFLGTGNVYSGKIKFQEFADARKFARSLNLRSYSKWDKWRKSGQRPADIPYEPERIYAQQGWRGYRDFLGNE